MMKKLMSLAAILLVAGVTVAAGDIDLEGVKCVVAPRPASADKAASYKEGKVYFCCGNCASKFAKDSKKFAAKANHQLVATKQYEQEKCPFSGGPLDDALGVKVAGTKVGFCCEGCQSKVAREKDENKQLELVFSDKAFAKAFKLAKDDDSE